MRFFDTPSIADLEKLKKRYIYTLPKPAKCLHIGCVGSTEVEGVLQNAQLISRCEVHGAPIVVQLVTALRRELK